jgi:hypothetical protein
MDARYAILWSNYHASGEFPDSFRTKKEAIAAARQWKQTMIDGDENKAAAKKEYQWSIIIRD